jgi:hypothetical protein
MRAVQNHRRAEITCGLLLHGLLTVLYAALHPDDVKNPLH